VSTELSERSELIEKMRPEPLREKKDSIKITSNVHAVNQERLRLNQTRTQNNDLRKQIDVMRKQLTNVKAECTKLKSKTNNVKRECQQQNTEYQKHKRLAEEHMNHSITFKAKFEEDKFNFEAQIKKMYQVLHGKDETEREQERSAEDVDPQSQ
jgi:hypothetical protein